jgi:hypothetical protein
MAVYYEWDVETHLHYFDEVEGSVESMDVIEHHFCDSFKDALEIFRQTPETHPEGILSHHLVLVRDDDEYCSWAYLDDNKLPEQFMDANGNNRTKVPQRFVKEVERALKA